MHPVAQFISSWSTARHRCSISTLLLYQVGLSVTAKNPRPSAAFYRRPERKPIRSVPVGSGRVRRFQGEGYWMMWILPIAPILHFSKTPRLLRDPNRDRFGYGDLSTSFREISVLTAELS